MARVKEDIQIIRLSPFLLEGKEHVDIRYWKCTNNGPRPTKKGMAIKRYELINLIIALQRVNAAFNSDDARRKETVNS